MAQPPQRNEGCVRDEPPPVEGGNKGRVPLPARSSPHLLCVELCAGQTSQRSGDSGVLRYSKQRSTRPLGFHYMSYFCSLTPFRSPKQPHFAAPGRGLHQSHPSPMRNQGRIDNYVGEVPTSGLPQPPAKGPAHKKGDTVRPRKMPMHAKRPEHLNQATRRQWGQSKKKQQYPERRGGARLTSQTYEKKIL